MQRIWRKRCSHLNCPLYYLHFSCYSFSLPTSPLSFSHLFYCRFSSSSLHLIVPPIFLLFFLIPLPAPHNLLHYFSFSITFPPSFSFCSPSCSASIASSFLYPSPYYYFPTLAVLLSMIQHSQLCVPDMTGFPYQTARV